MGTKEHFLASLTSDIGQIMYSGRVRALSPQRRDERNRVTVELLRGGLELL